MNYLQSDPGNMLSAIRWWRDERERERGKNEG